MSFLLSEAMSAKDVVNAVTDLAWPVLVGAIVWRLFPTIRSVMSSRAFSIKAGGAEITVQQASDQLADRVEDLREQLSALKAQVAAGTATPTAALASPIAEGVARLRRVLWVDDHPENNVYEVQALLAKAVSVDQSRSTTEALEAVRRAAVPFDVVVTDMGRVEDGTSHDEAGLELLRGLRAGGIDVPVVVYASATAVSRNRDRLMDEGVVAATSSATELLEILGRLGLA